MYTKAMVIGAIIIGGIVFLAMSPSIQSAMNINTTGWKSLFKAGVSILPYALAGLFVLWVISRKGSNSSGK
jgi:uncharacterized membrane protein